MKLNKFGRNYSLSVRLSQGEAIEITPEMRIVFDATKEIKSRSTTQHGGKTSPSTANIAIYNLEPSKRAKLVKYNPKAKDYLQVILAIGYDQIQTIFKGNIVEAQTEKSGADFITKLACEDGGYDFKNSFISANVKGKNEDIINALLATMGKTQKGVISPREKEIIRGKILLGSTATLLDREVGTDRAWFIDEEKLNVIADNEVKSGQAVVLNSETGLLKTPVRKVDAKKKTDIISASCLLEPKIKLGGLVSLESTSIKAVCRVEKIRYYGDFNGNDWSMDLELKPMNDYKVVS